MIKHLVRTLVLCTLLAGALTAMPVKPALAFVGNTLYVATWGANSGNCQNSASPCATIHYAITQAVSGDRIYVGAGTYHENNIVININLSILGVGQESTMVDGGGTNSVFVIGAGTSVSLETLAIQNGVTTGVGGGINNDGNLYMTQVSIHDNNAASGGGIFSSGPLQMYDVAVFNNISTASGGGLFLNQSGSDDFDRVAVYGNQALGASNYSGGIHQQGGGRLALTNVTIYNNTAQYGGGITNAAASTLHVVNSTISGNHAVSVGGFLNYATADFKNSLLSGNQDADCSNAGTLTDNGYNLLSDSSCGAAFTEPHDLHGTTVSMNWVFPSWSGYVPVLAPVAGSATIDAGTNSGCPADDGRMVERSVDGDLNGSVLCDIGAYEYRPASAITVTSDTPDPSRAGVPFSVHVNVTGAGPTPTGTVAVQVAETSCYITLSAGSGSCMLTPLISGVREINVYHEGDAQYEGSSNFVAHTVTRMAKLVSVGADDGQVLESSETSGVGGTLNASAGTFALGDDAANRQYRAILHFNTASLPDTAVIVKATLQIKKQGLVGTNPFTTLGGLLVDIRNPFFGTTAGLQTGDFQAAGTSAVATFGTVPDLSWYSAVLNGVGRARINRIGTTQFRLRFALDDNNDHIADFIKFFSGNAAASANRPVLQVEYYVP